MTTARSGNLLWGWGMGMGQAVCWGLSGLALKPWSILAVSRGCRDWLTAANLIETVNAMG